MVRDLIECPNMFEISEECINLQEFLRNEPPTGIWTYFQIREALGMDVQYKHRQLLYSALDAIRPEGIFYGTVRGEGLQWLTDAEYARQYGSYVVRKFRKASKRALRRMDCVDVSKLTDAERKEFLLNTAVVGTIGMFSSRRGKEKINNEMKNGTDNKQNVKAACEAVFEMFGKR